MLDEIFKAMQVCSILYIIFMIIVVLGTFARIIPQSFGIIFSITTVIFISILLILTLIIIMIKTWDK